MKRNALAVRAAAPAVLSCLFLAGCNPLIQIGGAYFPAWLFCSLAGIAAAYFFYLLFVALRLHRGLWHGRLTYGGLAVLSACLVYLALFR